MTMLRRLTAHAMALPGAVTALSRSITDGPDGRSTYAVTRWVFLRALGLVYLVAFVSLGVQVRGLMGGAGILPAHDYLDAARVQLGFERFRLIPTVFWLNSSDMALQGACGLGALCAALIICDVAPTLNLVVSWILYLSLVVVGQDFLEFQWDGLLLETGLLAVFFARTRYVSTTVLVLLWWLLFRLIFQSGLVKLTWADPTWRDLTAFDYHFYTQPLPTWAAWYANQLPAWSKRFAVLATLLIELVCPFLIFGPRRLRVTSCAAIVLMQVGILGTGNYTFFNVLTIALACLLLDDAFWARVLPAALMEVPAAGGPGAWGETTLAAVVLFVSVVAFWENVSPGVRPPDVLVRATAWAAPFRSINNYGLFRVMTTARQEIVIEGSDDLHTWRTYEFRAKPGDVMRRPMFVEPHQPRLDWQTWFAALSPFEMTPWFQAFLGRLLENSQPVVNLLAANPFPTHPPRYVRALLYDYHFTSAAERRATGAWWTRTLVGPYSPLLTLSGGSLR